MVNDQAPHQRLRHLPSLDGLRALAVALVVAYHLDIGWASGGFLGVDLFFVISGFLITTLLLREHADSGRIGLRTFWYRRFRRLVPPLVVMVVAVVAATRWWGVPEQWASVRGDATAALGYVANWRFIADDQSYFDTLLGPSPLRHTWSLAVEEQWYLMWPLAMVGLCLLGARARRRSRALPLVCVLVAAVASATWMAYLFVPADPSRVYYGTDTRAQQLLIGSALAWIVHLWPSLDRRIAGPSRRATGVAALVALVSFVAVAATTDDDASWLYRGGLFGLSMLGALVVLAVANERPPATVAWLGAAPLVWIGKRSYSIYLWHWPVIVFVGPAMGIELSRYPLMAVQVAVTMLLAVIAYEVVETPARRSSRRPGVMVATWTAGAALGIALCFVALVAPEGRTLSSATVIRPSMLTDDASGSGTLDTVDGGDASNDASNDGEAAVAVVDETAGSASSQDRDVRTTLLLGDSTAFTLGMSRDPTLDPTWVVELFARLGCPITDGATVDSDADVANFHEPECRTWRADWEESVLAVQPDVSVVMVGSWEVLDHRVDGVDLRFPSPEWEAHVDAALRDAADVAGSSGAPVVFLTLPCMKPTTDETTARTEPERVAAVNDVMEAVAAADPDVSISELGDFLCVDGASREDVDGHLTAEEVRYDGTHYTQPGADAVWQWLIPQLESRLP